MPGYLNFNSKGGLLVWRDPNTESKKFCFIEKEKPSLLIHSAERAFLFLLLGSNYKSSIFYLFLQTFHRQERMFDMLS